MADVEVKRLGEVFSGHGGRILRCVEFAVVFFRAFRVLVFAAKAANERAAFDKFRMDVGKGVG